MLDRLLHHRLEQHDQMGLTRMRHIVDNRYDTHIILRGQEFINFTSNDYLGIANHTQVKKSFHKGINKYGYGSGASALVSGYYESSKILEEKFAQTLNFEKALFFSSGYHANLGVITTLANRNTTIIADRLCHASILDGIQLSRAKHWRYHHNNSAHAETLISQAQTESLLITESVFSMEGDTAPIADLIHIAKNHNGALIVDDADGFGILGQNGNGIAELYHDIDCLIIPLGKALGGIGAIVLGSAVVINTLIQFAHTYKYTTALPPAIAVANLQALEVMHKETWRREKLISLISYFNELATSLNLPLISYDLTPIRSILISKPVLRIQDELQNQGFFVAGIRPPTVPIGTSRIRISLNCFHSIAQVSRLLNCMVKILC